ncbi:MAG: HAMP domain-containing protein [Candidatus Omnitrophica bacterium]|nr:HAMP domain-containing protein [Candidatus Omnitrophota bacterium]
MLLRSIRFKIILWNIALLTLVFIVCGTLAYKSLKWNLYRNLDDLLSSRAYGVTESIDTYWEMEKSAAARQGILTATFSKVDNANFIKIARHWVEAESGNPELLNIVVQIFDGRGRPLVASADLSRWRTSTGLPVQALPREGGSFDNIAIDIQHGNRLEARSFVIPVRENGQTAYIVRLITPLSDVNAHLLQLRLILFCVLPLIIFLTGIVGAFLARVSLSPLHSMINDINRITARNLHSHVDVPRTHDEVQRLAETFNSMLDRIHADFLTQQRFIQDMSHEIKTPLTIMRGSMEVALKKVRSQERYEKLMQDSLEQIARLSGIVEALLVLARFDNREVTLQLGSFDLAGLAERSMDELRVLAEAKGIQMERFGDAPVELEADESQIKILLLNLLDNAIKYTPPGGRIAVALKLAGDSARLEVRDTGIGIGPDDLPHVFERFYRAEGPASKEKGFGLGLSLVKSIVDTHRGIISVTSRLQEGTIFTVLLPLRAADSVAQGQA